jgi:hypothetical protein
MPRRIRQALLALLSAGLFLVPATVGVVSAAAQTTHPAVHAQPADTPDGYPDETAGELYPDITARPMCLSSAPNWCAHVHDSQGFIWDGSATGSGTSYNVKFKPNGNQFCWNGHCYNVGTLNFPGESPACIGINQGAGYPVAQLANCTTGGGIIWGHGHSGCQTNAGCHDVWINRQDTQVIGSLRVLVSNAGSGTGFGPLSSGDWFNSALYRKWNF